MSEGRVRTARHLVFRLRDGSVVGANPSSGAARRLPEPVWNLLRRTDDWRERSDLEQEFARALPDVDRARALMLALVEERFLLVEGSAEDLNERTFDEAWPFGESTADHWIVTRNLRFSDDRTEAVRFGRALRSHAGDDLAPEASPGAAGVSLPDDALQGDVREVLRRRRSRRDFTADPIELTALAAVLEGMAGVVELRHVVNRPPLPLTYAPSAGGLNGVECYVVTKAVAGLEPAVYRYRPRSRFLELIAPVDGVDRQHLLGNQRWADTAAAIIVLVGAADRTAWKYDAASGFNAMLLQAGHIAQNGLIVAAGEGLGAVPSNALHVTDVERALRLDSGRQIVLTSISIGNVDGPVSRYEEYLAADLALMGKMAEL